VCNYVHINVLKASFFWAIYPGTFLCSYVDMCVHE
jgi:hypothetical protein